MSPKLKKFLIGTLSVLIILVLLVGTLSYCEHSSVIPT